MKVLVHGTHSAATPPIQCKCENCRCIMEVEEHEIEGNSARFVWCPECREAVYLPSANREVRRA